MDDYEEIKPWERQPGESEKCFNYFKTYKDMGTDRTRAKLAVLVGKSKPTMETIAKKWHWIERINAYNDHIEKISLATIEKEIKEMVKRHAVHAQSLETAIMIPVNKFMKKYQENVQTAFGDLSLGELLDLVFSSADKFPKLVNVERLSRGVPTDYSKADLTSGGEKFKPVINITVSGSKSKLLESLQNESQDESRDEG